MGREKEEGGAVRPRPLGIPLSPSPCAAFSVACLAGQGTEVSRGPRSQSHL